jgi:outer membrane protein
MYSTLAAKVYDVLNTYAKQYGYTVILDMGEQGSPVLYADSSLDITKPIVEAYNVKSGVPVQPARPPATPASPPAGH